MARSILNLSYEEIKAHVESNNYKLISKEYNKYEKIKVECDKGHIYDVAWYKFYIGQRCKECFLKYKNKLQYEDVKKYIESVGYNLISKEYKNNSEKLVIQCNKNHIYKASFNKFKTGNQRCPECAQLSRNEKLRYPFSFAKSEIEKLNGYKVLSLDNEYINQSTKLKIQCPIGHIFEKSTAKFRGGQHCTICQKENMKKKLQKPYDEIKSFIEANGYKLISKEVPNVRIKIDIECDKGHIYSASYMKFCEGQRCSVCNETSGEIKIRQFLERNNLNFQSQYRISECRYKLPLPFDFAVLDDDMTIRCLIEYDGRQHFEDINGDLEYRKRNDKIKDEYCKTNQIKLIRIPYWNFDKIEEILSEKI